MIALLLFAHFMSFYCPTNDCRIRCVREVWKRRTKRGTSVCFLSRFQLHIMDDGETNLPHIDEWGYGERQRGTSRTDPFSRCHPHFRTCDDFYVSYSDASGRGNVISSSAFFPPLLAKWCIPDPGAPGYVKTCR